ncbi:NlpC/P60 family protein [Fodinicola acaciae]|uniref:NlpC/P60 family protein n=1 Tax=Fodinicola acaciae TaxID=2681555 RepID=UPI0013D7C2F1|nr:NlpC/P60 family protein [Fodinicola acaciae]
MRTHRRSLPRPLKNKWLTATLGVAGAGIIAAGVLAAPTVFAAESLKVTLARYNSPQSIPPGGTAYLRGTVKTPQGQPAGNVPVTISRLDGKGHYASFGSSRTDSNGVVTFTLRPGSSNYYAISASGATIGGGCTQQPAGQSAQQPAQQGGAQKTGDSKLPERKPAADSSSQPADATADPSSDPSSSPSDTTPSSEAPTKCADGTAYAGGMSSGVPIYVQNKGQQVVQMAYQYRGKPYRYGAAGPNSFDCSGYTLFIYGKFGKRLPHSATSQSHYGTAVSRSQMKPGDLMLFGKPGSYYHAAIYAGGNEMWDASTYGKPTAKHKIWSNNYVVRRIVT